MAQDHLITNKEILDSFLVTSMYKSAGSWPHVGIAACKITCIDEKGKEWVSHQVYRNNPSENHFEKNILDYLKGNKVVKNSSKIMIKVYQNYSPCKECAEEICDYINRGKAKITITFANFYLTHAYSNVRPDGRERGNPPENAKANIEGLRKLNKCNGVRLRLLGVHLTWEEFLGMSQFFSFNEDECLDKADSPGRKDRERQDQMVWDEIFRPSSAHAITSGLEGLRLS